MARLELVHWHVIEAARVAALGAGAEPIAAAPHDALDTADPWDLLRTAMNLPVTADTA